MSQNSEILEHLQQGDSITALEALKRFGCFRLAARIKDLKEQGHMIQCRTLNLGAKKVAQYSIYREGEQMQMVL